MYSRNNTILPIRKKILSSLLIFSTFINISLAYISPKGCNLTTNGTPGAIVKFYDYPLDDPISFQEKSFLLGGYLQNKYEGEVTGVKNISWDSGWPAVNHPYGFEGVPITNFVMEITGYYRAPQTGLYTISLKVDDFAVVFMGAGSAFDCCSQNKDFTADQYIVSNIGSAVGGLVAATHEMYMEEGHYYPFKVVYVNYMQRCVLDLMLTQPDGTVDTQIGENLYSFPDNSAFQCPTVTSDHEFITVFKTEYSTSTRSFLPNLTAPTTVSIITTTSWINDTNGDVKIIDVVDEPLSTSSIYTVYTTTTTSGSVATTSTYTTAITGSDGFSTPEVIVIVEIPAPSTLHTTTTTFGSIATTSTYTTAVTGSDGFSTPEVIVIVETAPPSTLRTTTTTFGSVPGTSTYTTAVTGSDGFSTPEVVIVVETPPPSTVYTTTTTLGSIATTSTYTTAVTGSDGFSTPEVVVVVETPAPSTLHTTTTTFGSVPGTSTYTTTITGSDGFSTPEVIVIVETPSYTSKASETKYDVGDTSYIVGTLTAFTTTTTNITTTVCPNGKTSQITVVGLENPTSASTSSNDLSLLYSNSSTVTPSQYTSLIGINNVASTTTFVSNTVYSTSHSTITSLLEVNTQESNVPILSRADGTVTMSRNGETQVSDNHQPEDSYYSITGSYSISQSYGSLTTGKNKDTSASQQPSATTGASVRSTTTLNVSLPHYEGKGGKINIPLFNFIFATLLIFL